MGRWIAMVIATLALGCANRTATTFSFQGRDNRDDQLAALSAAEEWNECHDPHFHIDVYIGDAPADAVPIVYQTEAIDDDAPSVKGRTDRNSLTGNVKRIVYDDTDRNYLPTLFAHEFGHAIGLGHYGNGVMAWGTYAGEHVTPDDCAHAREAE